MKTNTKYLLLSWTIHLTILQRLNKCIHLFLSISQLCFFPRIILEISMQNQFLLQLNVVEVKCACVCVWSLQLNLHDDFCVSDFLKYNCFEVSRLIVTIIFAISQNFIFFVRFFCRFYLKSLVFAINMQIYCSILICGNGIKCTSTPRMTRLTVRDYKESTATW